MTTEALKALIVKYGDFRDARTADKQLARETLKKIYAELNGRDSEIECYQCARVFRPKGFERLCSECGGG